MKLILVITLLAICLSACTSRGSDGSAAANSRNAEDEKHRLYTAALAASESPLDSDLFKDACRKIGIFDDDGKPNDKYMAFVAAHVEWGTKVEAKHFKQEIDTQEKARDYVNKHLRQ